MKPSLARTQRGEERKGSEEKTKKGEGQREVEYRVTGGVMRSVGVWCVNEE
jgi:hypothetical protein